MTDTLETVTFKLANGIADEALLAANVAMTEWISCQAGFRYRSLSQFDDGSWIDVVYWASKAEADAADVKFKAEMLSSDFAMMLDVSTVKIRHSTIQAQNMAAQAA